MPAGASLGVAFIPHSLPCGVLLPERPLLAALSKAPASQTAGEMAHVHRDGICCVYLNFWILDPDVFRFRAPSAGVLCPSVVNGCGWWLARGTLFHESPCVFLFASFVHRGCHRKAGWWNPVRRPWGELWFSFYNWTLIFCGHFLPTPFILNISTCFAIKKMGEKNPDIDHIKPDISFHIELKV